jgi:uncharacterized membrane protein SpoIIM required for sporulation
VVVHEFIRTRQDAWARLQSFLEQARQLSLARVPLDAFREGSALYRQTVADLAYARMCFPLHPVVRELEQLVGQAHSLLYQAGRARSRSWTEFWRATWPIRVREAAGLILLAAGIFWASAIVGFVLTAQNPVLESFFVSPAKRQAITSKRLWTEPLARTAPQASSGIAVNNINVSLMTWGLGLTFGIGTVWLLVLNGVMLGAISAVCLRAGLFSPLAEFVIAHGSLELPAIWIAGGAGLLMARAMVFPGRYSRRVELRQNARKSVQIIIGIVPILLVAGAIEGFVSPSTIPGAVKALLGLSVALGLLAYVVVGGRGSSSVDHESTKGRKHETRITFTGD